MLPAPPPQNPDEGTPLDGEVSWEAFAEAIQLRLWTGADEYDQPALWWGDGVLAQYGGSSQGWNRDGTGRPR